MEETALRDAEKHWKGHLKHAKERGNLLKRRQEADFWMGHHTCEAHTTMVRCRNCLR